MGRQVLRPIERVFVVLEQTLQADTPKSRDQIERLIVTFSIAFYGGKPTVVSVPFGYPADQLSALPIE